MTIIASRLPKLVFKKTTCIIFYVGKLIEEVLEYLINTLYIFALIILNAYFMVF